MQILSHESNRARSMWKSCVASAFRTALGCSIVGCITLYGPAAVKRHITFPAFSYVTVILIVTNANLGDAFRGCWLALYATVLSVSPAILWLWFVGPAHLTMAITSALVAAGAFLVMLPRKAHLITKRIALGQVVIVYVLGFIKGAETEPVMHPVHVAASTAIGVLACVFALLLPFPSLASYEVKKSCRLFAENASDRLNLFVKAFCEEDKTAALALISQAKSMAATGTKLLQSIKSKQESMQWEKIPIKFLKPYCKNPGQRLQEIETPLMGMDIALSNCHSFPVKMVDKDLKDGIQKLEDHINLTFAQIKKSIPSTVPADSESLHTLKAIMPPTNQKELPSFFFLFCLKLLAALSGNKPQKAANSSKNHKSFVQRLMPACKCSLSLFFAVLFGLLYSKKDGYWAGLPVAITLASSREATFKVANLKAQGTMLGTVYGVLACFVFEKHVKIRFISLLPWFIFTSFLRNSRMYGQAGGISAVIGAVLILGRDNFGPPSEFAIARIVETCIGLSCSIMVDILFQPTRASTLAKIELSKSLESLHECVRMIILSPSTKANLDEESQKAFKFHVNELRKFIGEAEVEPNFWVLPFHSASYNKLLGSLSKMVEFLFFGTYAIGFIEQELKKIDVHVWEEIVTQLDRDIELLKEMVASPLKCFEEITKINSLATLEKVVQNNNVVVSIDLELGKSPFPVMFRSSGSDIEDEVDKVISSFLRNSAEIPGIIYGGEDEEESKSEMVLSLSALAFCMGSLVKETREIEKAIKEFVQWENPSSHVNLHEISCKIHALDLLKKQ